MKRTERGVLGISLIANIAILALLALAAYEAGTVILARLKVQDVAETAATEGARVFRETTSEDGARAATLAKIAERDPNASLETFAVQADGSVSVEIRKRPGTLVIHRIGFLRGFATAIGRSTAAPPRGL